MFEHYLGRRQCEGFADPLTRQACRAWLDKVLACYGDDDNVDIAIIDHQLPLTAETADYLYAEFTPTDPPPYQPGQRPLLERVVRSVVSDGMSARDKALALLRRCRDNAKFADLPDRSVFWGGSEEDLLRRGATMCNEISRLFCCLAQIAGLPARVYSAHLTGHMMNEVYVDGRWWWMDVMRGLYFLHEDGSPASAWDLLRDPTLCNRQRIETFADCTYSRPFWRDHPRARELNLSMCVARTRDCYFNSREAAAIGNYGLADYPRCSFPWYVRDRDPANEALHRHRRAILIRRIGAWPDYFWNWTHFDEPLKTIDSDRPADVPVS